MAAKYYTKEIQHSFSDSPGSTITITYIFSEEGEGYSFGMSDLKEYYCGEVSSGADCEIQFAYGDDPLDFIENLLSKEDEMMFSLEELINCVDKGKEGRRVALNLRRALKKRDRILQREVEQKTQLAQKQAIERELKKKAWDELPTIVYLRSTGYRVPESPEESIYEGNYFTISANKLAPEIKKAISQNDMKALDILIEISRGDILLGAYAFEEAGKYKKLEAIKNLVKRYGYDEDLRLRNIWWNGAAISQPFKIVFETGFEEGAAYILGKKPDIENRVTSKQVNSGKAQYDELKIQDWVNKAGEQGFLKLLELLQKYNSRRES